MHNQKTDACDPGDRTVNKANNSITHRRELLKKIVAWVDAHQADYPLLDLMFSTAQGKSKTTMQYASLREYGIKRGVPRLIVPCVSHNPRKTRKWNGMAIEIKYADECLSSDQMDWKTKLEQQGWLYGVVRKLDDFVFVVDKYHWQ